MKLLTLANTICHIDTEMSDGLLKPVSIRKQIVSNGCLKKNKLLMGLVENLHILVLVVHSPLLLKTLEWIM